MSEEVGSEPICYRVYGITLASNFPFQTPLHRAEGAPDLSSTRVWEAPDAPSLEGREALFESRHLTEDGQPQIRLYRGEGCHLFRQAGVADWYMWADQIVCHQYDDSATQIVELYFLSLLCGFWLESRGTVVLHASAVSVGSAAAVFLATNRGGKTSLATSLLEAGHPLLTDDFLAVSVSADGAGPLGHPGFPQMRMWPDLADHFLGRHGDLPRVLPDIVKRRVPVQPDVLGPFCTESRVLARLYLPERGPPDSDIRIEPVPQPEALIEIVRESFLSTVLEKAGLHGERFVRLASLVRRVPMKRVTYPEGLDRLPSVRAAILADLEASS